MPKKSCYVISSIGEQGSVIREHADKVFEFIISPAAERAELQPPVRADKDLNSSVITNSILKHIYEDDLVVAVLSGKNPNVFYELSLRHALKKPCVHLIDESSWPPPFDIAGMNIIRYDLSDWRSPKKAQEELIQAIKIGLSGAPITNPISTAIAVHKLIESNDPDIKNIGILANQLQGLAADLSEVKRSIKSLQKPITFNSSPSTSPFTLQQSTLGPADPAPFGSYLSDYLVSSSPGPEVTLDDLPLITHKK